MVVPSESESATTSTANATAAGWTSGLLIDIASFLDPELFDVRLERRENDNY